MTPLIFRARVLAVEAHASISQKRKYSGEPYVEHPKRVSSIVAGVTNDENMIAAALLHDVYEDVFPIKSEYSLQRIANETNATVAVLVFQLSNLYTKEACPQLNREVRHKLEVERLALTCPDAKTIKLADLIDNTSDIIKHDKDFARTYLREKIDLLPRLKEGSKILWDMANDQVKENLPCTGGVGRWYLIRDGSPSHTQGVQKTDRGLRKSYCRRTSRRR